MDTVDIVRGKGLESLGVAHGFTGRGGGASGAAGHCSLLAGAPEGLTLDALEANWGRALSAVHPSLSTARLALVRQVHGNLVCVARAPTGVHAMAMDADAVVTNVPGLAVAVRVADCVPILLAAPGGVAAVHAGWRGVASGVVHAALHELTVLVGCAPSDVRAVIGPHIGQAAFEVGPEVVAAIEATGVSPACFSRAGRADRAHVDLGAALTAQLGGLGVVHVEATGGDTTTGPYFSWRAQGPQTGRQAGIIAWLG